MWRIVLLSFVVVSFGGCHEDPASTGEGSVDAQQAQKGINPDRIRNHIARLSDDEFEGRGPGTPGAAKARDYIIGSLEASGIVAGNGGSWIQKVPLRQVNNTNQSLSISGQGIDRSLKLSEEFVGENKRGPGTHTMSGELVLVGHGVQAPEYGWDDYKGFDCRGKVLVMFVGDPPTADESLFGGKAMTYYGRWTHKFEKAEELGAAGCLVIHHKDWAGYGWLVVRNSWAGRHMNVQSADADDHLPFEGWLQWHIVEELVRHTGKTLDQIAAEAATRDFKPIPLGIQARGSITTTSENIEDENIVGVLPGSDPGVSDEFVVWTAHYDHLGKQDLGPEKDGIYNGAVDNASGCAALLSIATAYGDMSTAPRRSTMFLFVCSEEQGLLGSRYYSQNPLQPLSKTLANINIDGLNVHEMTQDVQVVGSGQSDLEQTLARQIHPDGRYTAPDSQSEKGYYYRSDHFNFARVGVPALFIKSGDRVQGKPSGYIRAIMDAWTRDRYHQPSDEYEESWPITGGAADARALFRVGLDVGNGDSWPQWSETSEFRAVREKSLGR